MYRGMKTRQLLRKGNGFAWTMVVMLALGVGGATAMFSVVNGILLQPLNFRDSGQLVLVGERVPQITDLEKFQFFDTPAAFFAWRRRADDFIGLSAIQSGQFTLMGAGQPQLLHGARVSGNFFDVLGVQSQLGRLLTADDEGDDTRPMVITDGLWRSGFGADYTVIDRKVGAPGASATIVGVLPADFRMEGSELGPMLAGQPTQYFLPLRIDPSESKRVFSDFNYTVLGRLRPGVTQTQALAHLNVIQADLARPEPQKLELLAQVTPVRDYAVADSRRQLWMLMAGVLAVLVIMSVNLGGLWTTRLSDRRRDWAIRAALGAAPGQLARQVLSESVGLSLLGGGLGVVCAAWSLHALLAAAPASLPRLNEVHLDWRVLAFGVLLSLLVGLITGVVPAVRSSHADPQENLKATGLSTTADRSSLRSRQILIGMQAALATLLLAAAGLLGLSFYRLVTQSIGFTAERALTANVVLNGYGADQRDRILQQLPAAAAAIPGVSAAAFTSHLPLKGETWIDGAGVPGRVYPADQEPRVNVRFVSPGYLAVIGIPLLVGRDYLESDRPAGWPPKSPTEESAMPKVVVISRATAEMLWPGLNPVEAVGRQIEFNGNSMPTVIGVSADARDGSISASAPSVVYQPYWENTPNSVSLVLRGPLSPESLAAPIRAAVAKLAAAAPVTNIQALNALQADAVAPQRYQLTLLLMFAGLALLLAAMGVYALVAHSVARRSRELAIRTALGARATDLWRLVFGEALAPVILGVGAGIATSLAVGRLLASFLFEVHPSNPLVLAAVATGVILAAAAACILPGRRATRLDPLTVLRSE